MKKVFTKFSLGAIICLMALASFGKGTITGKLIDAGTDEALIGATVVVDGTTIGMVTNFDGIFELSLEAGKQTIIMSYIGYITKEMVVSVTNDKTNDLGTIILESDAIGINEAT